MGIRKRTHQDQLCTHSPWKDFSENASKLIPPSYCLVPGKCLGLFYY